MLNTDIKKSIDTCVLCWLATVDENQQPNVSPKEMFTYLDDHTLLIANIASPNSVRNIAQQPKVSVSFVDVFIQKGFKLKGEAKLITRDADSYAAKAKRLTDLFSDKFPIHSVIEITITKVNLIQAPSYWLFPDSTTEQSQIEGAMKTYGVKPG
jgi:predicted pyridoxine 5'-phosphate oxidase superfamily flavin-nucleotide-binding protein